MVVADDGHIFELRLSDQHPIEWIAMLSRQSSGTLCVQHGDVERRESLPSNAPGHVGGHIERPRQLAEPSFGRDFPGRCRTDQNGVRLVTYRTPRFERQTTRRATQSSVCVSSSNRTQHQRSVSSRGSGSKNALVTFARPRMAPKRRCGRLAPSRVSRATGVAPRAIITSSPSSARSMRRESCVFAAWIEWAFFIYFDVS